MVAVFNVAASEREHHASGRERFAHALKQHGTDVLRRDQLTTLQINVGRVCNQACLHCHVEAGPKRTEQMSPEVADRLIALLQASPQVHTVDITGGAPELNPEFRRLVTESRRLGRHVMVRHNLTVMFEPGQGDLDTFYADNRCEVIASLPCYGPDNVNKQRGKGVFGKSIDALLRLNAVGYGQSPDSDSDTGLKLHLVYNPLGPSLPPAQASLEAAYKERLKDDFGVVFNQLFTLANMPIKRFAHDLIREGKYSEYMTLLASAFNPATVEGLMCRSLISVDWTGRLYDCDFNQMLLMDPPDAAAAGVATINDIETLGELDGREIAVGSHCFGCTAGAGSSCGGALA